jgi:hypothetical protein
MDAPAPAHTRTARFDICRDGRDAFEHSSDEVYSDAMRSQSDRNLAGALLTVGRRQRCDMVSFCPEVYALLIAIYLRFTMLPEQRGRCLQNLHAASACIGVRGALGWKKEPGRACSGHPCMIAWSTTTPRACPARDSHIHAHWRLSTKAE